MAGESGGGAVGLAAEPRRRFAVTAQGEYLHCKPGRWQSRGKNPGGGSRGLVTSFSAESRKRMLDMFAKLDKKAVRRNRVLFVTLTYPVLMLSHEKVARDVKAFAQRVKRAFPDAWLIWKKEPQKSGSLHVHWMIGGVGFMDVQDWQRAWNEVSGYDANNSLDLESLRSINGVMFYVSKYMSKDTVPAQFDSEFAAGRCEPSTRHRGADTALGRPSAAGLGLSVSHIFPQSASTGRWWGVYGRKNLPLAESVTVLPVATESMYRWWLSKVDSEYCAVGRGWTVYTPRAAWLVASFMTISRTSGWVEREVHQRAVERWRRLDDIAVSSWRSLPAAKQREYLLGVLPSGRGAATLWDAPD